MVRRSFLVRSLIAMWGVWLGVIFSEPAALHSCPAHGAHAAHVADMSTTTMSHSAMSHDASHQHDSSKPCTCLGASCCANATVIPNAPVANLIPTDGQIVVAVFPTVADRASIVAPPHSLPFANGPPSTRSI